MAAKLATIPAFEPVTGARVEHDAASWSRRLANRWISDPETGALICVWDEDREPRRPTLHLRLVHG
jgi:hypothetical protein